MQIVGHRGAAGLAAENTIAAFKAALGAKVDMIEFDVVVSKDHIPIVCHDPYISTRNDPAAVKNSSLKRLKGLKTDLITLKEALDFIDGRAKVFVEIKSATEIGPIVKVLKGSLKKYGPDRMFLASFDQKTLRALHKALPELPVIVIEPLSSIKAIYRARQLKTSYIAMNKYWLWSGLIKAASKRGWHVYAYTVNNPKSAKRLNKCGLHGLITDYPDRF